MLFIFLALVAHASLVLGESRTECSIPPPAELRPSAIPTCNGRLKPGVSAYALAKDIAHEVAPIIYFHPHEESFLVDPKRWLTTSKIFTKV